MQKGDAEPCGPAERLSRRQNDGHPDGTYGNNIMCGATTLSKVVFVERYICCDCGYTEEWVDKSKLEMVLNSKKTKNLE